MSGIVGIIHLDGSRVDPKLLQRMMAYLQERGPDAQHTFLEGHVGLGHTLLKTTFEAHYETQPHTLESQVYLVADARIDNRKDLMAKLRV